MAYDQAYATALKCIAALERKLASLDWTPITPGNLPKVGDEVLRIRISNSHDGKIEIVGANWDAGWLQARPVYYEYRRPIGTPALKRR
jgi:hypothetical protein